MLRRSTLILLIVFILLAVFAYLFQRYQTQKAEGAATATPTSAPVKVYTLGGTQVDEIKISEAAGKEIDLYRDSATSKWAIADVPVDQADSAQIEAVSTQLLDLQVQETLTQTVPLEAIGLVTPAYTITFTTTDGAQIVTNIGSLTPTGNGYYIRLDSNPVIIVDKVALDDILHLLSNPPLLPTPTPKVTPSVTVVPTDTQASPTATP